MSVTHCGDLLFYCPYYAAAQRMGHIRLYLLRERRYGCCCIMIQELNNFSIGSVCECVVNGTSILLKMYHNRRSCKNSPNSFCYIQGELTFKSQRRSITDNVKEAYYLYFGCKVGEQDKNCASHVYCVTCYVKLTEWLQRRNINMSFAVLMIWRQPTSHLEDCYFCITKIEGFSRKTKDKIVYPTLP